MLILYLELWWSQINFNYWSWMSDLCSNRVVKGPPAFLIDTKRSKADASKLRLMLVPRQIIRDIDKVREYGVVKYPEPDS